MRWISLPALARSGNSRDYRHTFFCLSESCWRGAAGPMEIPQKRQNVDNVSGEAFLGQERKRLMKRQTTEPNGQPRRELSAQQQAAVELLAAGKTDKQAAETLNLPAERVAKWRLYDPVFQAALNACRAEAWQASINRLRSKIPQALDTLAEELNRADNPNRCKLALDIHRLAKLPDIAPQGPTDPETIVRQAVNRSVVSNAEHLAAAVR